jgi:anhydro-N-acetylmuramic acid kinase
MKTEYTVLGLMSGTSLDGLDMALCHFVKADAHWTYDVIAAETAAYEDGLRARLATATSLPAHEFMQLDAELASVMAGAIGRFLSAQTVRPDLIASHGHTTFHQPDKRLTVQIGSGAILAALTGITTVCDFRTTDVALGGQGAPLVPVGDELLYGRYEACLNLGGFANISFRKEGRRVAYDVSPCNMAFHYPASQLGLDYDKDGEISRRGKVDQPLLEALNGMDYYRSCGAKSLGKEWFEAVFRPHLDASPASVTDKLRTITEHVAIQLAQASRGNEGERMLVTGGGARNVFLIERLRALSNKEIVIPDLQTVDFKEAIIFAFLGVLRMRGEANCLSAVTGARTDSCGGAVYQGRISVPEKS